MPEYSEMMLSRHFQSGTKTTTNLLRTRATVAILVTCFCISPPAGNNAAIAFDSQSLRTDLNNLVANEVDAAHIPGYSLLVVKDGVVLLDSAHGFANRETKKPASSKTVFGIASITKTFTAVCLLKLVDEKKVDLDASISKYLPQTPESWKGITVRDLACMSSGIPSSVDLPWNQELKRVAHKKILFKHGTRYEYSNTDYRLLGSIIEKVTSKPYLQVVRETVIQPLGLKQTGAIDANPEIAQGYIFRRQSSATNKQYKVYKEVLADYRHVVGKHKRLEKERLDPEISKTQLSNSEKEYERLLGAYSKKKEMFSNQMSTPTRYRNPSVSFSAGMLASSCNDLAKYAQALLAGKILSRNGYKTMWLDRPHISGKLSEWAYGWRSTTFSGKRLLRMNGAKEGVASTILIFPEEKLIVVSLSNLRCDSAYEIPELVAKRVLSVGKSD